MKYKILWLVVVLLILLGIRFWFFYKDMPVNTDGQKVSGVYGITSEPKIFGGRQSFYVKDEYGSLIKVMTTTSPLYKYSDRVFIDGIFTKKFHEDRFYSSINFPKIQRADSDVNILTKSAFWIRNKAQNIFERHLPPIPSSLLLGIIFGGKYGMPEAFEENLRVTGVMHVVAASGMNVAFVSGALLIFLSKIFRRQAAIFIAGLGVIFYMFLAGLEPSIVRAGIMALLAFGAGILGKQYYGIYALLLTLYAMLLVDPVLLTDVGFQLSFLSTLGILIVKPGFFSLKAITGARKPIVGVLSDDIGTTIAAQIGALPIMLSVFGSIGLLSILVNALVLWTIPIVMTFGTLAILTGLIFEPLGQLFLYISLPFLWIFELVVSFFGGFGWTWEVEEFNWQFSVGYYLVVMAVILILRKNKKRESI